MDNLAIVSVKLVREASVPYTAQKINSPEDVVDLLRSLLEDCDREKLIAVFVSAKHVPTAINTISIGTLSSSDVHPREVFKAAILANAHAIILAHNHPSGDPSPSENDLKVTERLKAAGMIIGIQVIDHIIIGCSGAYKSMHEVGLI